MRIADLEKSWQFDRKATRAGIQLTCCDHPNFGQTCRWRFNPAATAMDW